jgi:hypothetical protein
LRDGCVTVNGPQNVPGGGEIGRSSTADHILDPIGDADAEAEAEAEH